MKTKDKLKKIAKTLTTENGSVFFTSEDYDNMKWLIRRVKALEKTLEFYADEENMHSLTGLPYGRRAREILGKNAKS
jgi:hypothetical protein